MTTYQELLRGLLGDRRRVSCGALGGYHESRRCSKDTYPESYITKYTSIRRILGSEIVSRNSFHLLFRLGMRYEVYNRKGTTELNDAFKE